MIAPLPLGTPEARALVASLPPRPTLETRTGRCGDCNSVVYEDDGAVPMFCPRGCVAWHVRGCEAAGCPGCDDPPPDASTEPEPGDSWGER